MLKKILSILLLSVIILSACSQGNVKTITNGDADALPASLSSLGEMKMNVVSNSTGGNTVGESVPEVLTHVEVERLMLSVDELAEMFPFVFVGKCEFCPKDSSESFYRFSVVQVLRGDIKEKEVEMKTQVDRFEPGETYLLYAQKWANVFSGKDYFMSDRVALLKDGKCESIIIEELNGLSAEEALRTVSKTLHETSCKSEYRKIMGDYIRSDDIETLWKASPFVFQLRIQETEMVWPDRKVVKAVIEKDISGKRRDGQTITVVVPLDTKEDESYVMFLTRASSESSFFVISSPYSIYPSGSEALKALDRLLEGR